MVMEVMLAQVCRTLLLLNQPPLTSIGTIGGVSRPGARNSMVARPFSSMGKQDRMLTRVTTGIVFMRQEIHLPTASHLVVEVKLKTSDFQRPTWITTGSF